MKPDSLIVDTLERILEDYCTPLVVNAVESGEWPSELWKILESAGLPLTWVGEAHAGGGAALIDGFEVAKVVGRYAAPVPLVETLLAGWVLEQADLQVPPGPLSVLPVRTQDALSLESGHVLSGKAHRVPFAGVARHLVMVTENGVGLVDCAGVEICCGVGLSGERYDTVSFDQIPVTVWSPGESLLSATQLMGATLRAQQMSGALERVLSLSMQYAGERHAFGRPIAKFQAVQHNLAVLAGEMAAAGAASGAAVRTVCQCGANARKSLLAVASAKVRTGEAAGNGAAIAHQVHGAIGYTHEFSLQQYTRRLLSWRDDFGSENYWAMTLGNVVADGGAEALWPALTSI